MAFKDEATRKEWYEKNKERLRAKQRAYYAVNAEKRKEYAAKYREQNGHDIGLKKRIDFIRSQYGVEMEEYLKMYAECSGKCTICKVLEEDMGHRMCVDHCHETGKVRGLLCKRCNAGLGQFKDNPELLIKAAEYLKRK